MATMERLLPVYASLPAKRSAKTEPWGLFGSNSFKYSSREIRRLEGTKPLAYLCTGTACQPPTDDPAGLREQISNLLALPNSNE